MRRQPVWIFLSLVVAIALPLGVAAADTGVSFQLQLGDRYRGPSVGFYDETDAVPIPGSSGVYYVRGSRNDVYRYGNAWYMNYNGDWYRATSTEGPWAFVSYRSVPRAVYTVPARYRRWRDYRDRHYMWTSGYRYRDRDRYGRSGVGFSLRIGDRYRGPNLGFYDEPTMLRVPGTYVYYTQDSDNDVYRYGNYWYMNYNGDWYRAGSFRGPWVFVSFRSVPRDVYSVPTQYRRRWSDYRDQHYGTDTSSDDDNVYYRGGTTTSSSLSLRIGSRYSGPSITFSTEPELVTVPGTRGVYYVQDSDNDIYRYGNSWYMNYNGDWYRAGSYNGPWVFVGYRSVPRDVYSVPSTYRRNWSDYRDQHYDDSDDNE